ncbi:MAG TPA: outer membrane beta-barrel protein [Gemmatimonadales bacterium]|nr:outer membrane beta-barrel protein [Gemmatimonadales bacterium]
MRIPFLTTRSVALTLALLLAGPLAATAAAQRADLEFTPFAGAYVPTANFEDLGGDIGNETSAAIGARLTFWGGGRIGFEGTFAFAPSDIDNPPGGTLDVDAQVITGNASLLLGLLPAGQTSALFLRLGGAVIARGGDAFDNVDGKTDFGGVVGLGLRIPLGPRFGIRIDAEDYLYNAKFDDDGESSFQNDLMFTVGLAIPLSAGDDE